MKTCNKCNEIKDLHKFCKKKNTKDGHENRCKLCSQANMNIWRSKNKDKVQTTNLKRYGITSQDYQEMFDAQLGSCAICKRIKTKETKTLCVDHCHTTGKVRGLLCHDCNTGIGKLQDSETILTEAILYLRK